MAVFLSLWINSQVSIRLLKKFIRPFPACYENMVVFDLDKESEVRVTSVRPPG